LASSSCHVGKLVLNRVPQNYFAEVEQAAFNPANMVSGIGPSPDRMLQARLFAYGDAHRYRLGINHTRLDVNAPKGVADGGHNYGRDGFMRFDDNGGAAKTYEPNSDEGTPFETGEPLYNGFEVSGVTGAHLPVKHREDDDFSQAGALYRLMSEEEKKRLIDNIASSLAQVSRQDVVERSIAHFRNADPDYGRRLTEALTPVAIGRAKA